jgi:membrane protein DedA with SNARE-associated domain
MLLLIGTLIAMGQVSAPLSAAVAVASCVFVDCVWFELGRYRKGISTGNPLALLAKTPRTIRVLDLCARHGAAALIVVRFLPGPNLLAALAGRARISRARFVLLDTAASVLWTSVYLVAGFFLPQRVRSVIDSCLTASPMGLIFLLLGLTAAWLGIHRIKQRASNGGESEPGVACGIASESGISPARIDLEDVSIVSRGILTESEN